jgi:tetratricopeptide (TPR) repeat protein
VTSKAHGLLSWLLLATASACSHGASRYDRAIESAENARARGYREEEREHYEDAARFAGSDDERAEALYRATKVHRAVDTPRAQADRLLALQARYPKTPAAVRALLDAARLMEGDGNFVDAAARYEQLIGLYPNSALAPRALDGLLHVWQDGHTSREVVLERFAHFQSLGAPALRELALFREASFFQSFDPKRAVAGYEALAREYPLPKGRYSDEALLESAKLRLTLGDVAGAEGLLKILAEAPAQAMMVGSYDRAAYAEAAFLRARVWAEVLQDLGKAEELFSNFAAAFPSSRLRDDAQFELARLLAQKGRAEDACRALRRLEKIDPDSRFLRCVALYCPTQAEHSSKSAPGLNGAAPRAEGGPALCSRPLPPLIEAPTPKSDALPAAERADSAHP